MWKWKKWQEVKRMRVVCCSNSGVSAFPSCLRFPPLIAISTTPSSIRFLNSPPLRSTASCNFHSTSLSSIFKRDYSNIIRFLRLCQVANTLFFSYSIIWLCYAYVAFLVSVRNFISGHNHATSWYKGFQRNHWLVCWEVQRSKHQCCRRYSTLPHFYSIHNFMLM